MKPKSSRSKLPAEQVVKDIRRKTRRHFSAEDKIRIVLDGLRGDDSIAELCRREGIAQSLYYTWSKEFMEAGKRRLAGDTARAATTDEVKGLHLLRSEGFQKRDINPGLAVIVVEEFAFDPATCRDIGFAPDKTGPSVAAADRAGEHHAPDAVGAGRIIARGRLLVDASLNFLVGGRADPRRDKFALVVSAV